MSDVSTRGLITASSLIAITHFFRSLKKVGGKYYYNECSFVYVQSYLLPSRLEVDWWKHKTIRQSKNIHIKIILLFLYNHLFQLKCVVLQMQLHILVSNENIWHALVDNKLESQLDNIFSNWFVAIAKKKLVTKPWGNAIQQILFAYYANFCWGVNFKPKFTMAIVDTTKNQSLFSFSAIDIWSTNKGNLETLKEL